MDGMIPFPNIPDVAPMTGATGIWLCSGIPWDSEYKNVRLFNNKDEAVAFIKSRAVLSSVEYTPIRNMTVRVDSNADVINRNINYIMFQNNYKTTDYWMAFITDIEWLSANSCRISFTWDVFQTWFYSCSIQRCFTAREHVSDDTIGLHTVEEGMDYGQLKVRFSTQPTTLVDGYSIVVYTAEDYTGSADSPTFVPAEGRIENNIYSALGYRIFTADGTGLDQCNEWFQTMIKNGRADSIAIVQMVPNFCVFKQTQSSNQVRPDNLDGYTPKNNKLFCYPYTRLLVSNNLGNVNEYRYELSTGSVPGQIEFELRGFDTTQPCIKTTPLNYNGMARDELNALTYSNIPQCAWVSNAYYSWYAQNRNSLALGVIGSLGGIATGAMLGGAPGLIGGTISASQSVWGSIGAIMDKLQIPSTVKGQVLNDNLNFAQDLVLPLFICQTVRREYAEIIDGFFSKFGYKVNVLKIPNTRGRQSWNYVETKDAIVNGNVGVGFIEIMENALNRGVTFWHTNDVGNYDLPNGAV